MKIRTLAPLALIAAASLSLTGCGSLNSGPTYNSVRSNLTPELMTLAERPIDVSNQMGVTFNTNRRAMWDDVQSFWLLDRPSRLTRYPMPH
jgi:hypothetical protein